jgi:hypothetical protein
MEGGRDAKLRRLNGFRRSLPHVSASALEAVLTAVMEQGMPCLHARKNMLEASLAILEAWAHLLRIYVYIYIYAYIYIYIYIHIAEDALHIFFDFTCVVADAPTRIPRHMGSYWLTSFSLP